MILSSRYLMPSLLVVAAITAACGGGEPGEPRAVSLTFPHALNAEHPVHKAIVKFKEEVERLSDGGMTIRVYEGSTIGSEQEMADNVAKGTNDLTKISAAILETKVPLAKVYQLPYLFRDRAHYWKVLDGEIGRELLAMAESAGLKGLCYYDAGFRSFYTKTRPIHTPDDLRGLKIRVMLSPMMERLIGAFGATPQAISFSELYTAIDTGVVHGAENNIPSYATEMHYKVAPFYSYDEHVAVPDIVLIGMATWNRLTGDQRRILQEAADASSRFQREIWEDEVARAVEELQREGVTFTHPDKAPFEDKVRFLYDEFTGTDIMDYVERIRAVR